jgi:glycosyltransferase involved in cell wall biosynthesis
MSHPLVSIALCTYNGERFLREQMDSLVQQSWDHLEIVVCDDVSTDGTVALLQEYVAKDNRVRLYCNTENLRLTKNVEKALGLCRGEYLMLCDQDDIWLPDKVASMMAAIGDEVLLYADSLLVNDTGQSLHKRISDLRRMYTGSDTKGFVLSNCVWGHAILLHRSLLAKALPIPADLPHDSWIGFVAASVQRIRYHDVALTLYRQHGDTVTSTLPNAQRATAGDRNLQEYTARMHWLRAVLAFPQHPDHDFYQTLYNLYVRKAKGRFVWPLFFFLLRHRRALYRFTYKSGLSQVNELRKQARGVK